MTLEPQRPLPPRESSTPFWLPLLWLIAASALAMTALMFAPVPPL